MMTDKLWRRLRKGTSLIYVEYGLTPATLFATDVRMQKGPPITIGLDLGKNLRTRNIQENTYIDAKELADGEMRRLKRMELHDAYVLTHLRRFLRDTNYGAAPWRLVVSLEGQHEFPVEAQLRGGDLILRVVES